MRYIVRRAFSPYDNKGKNGLKRAKNAQNEPKNAPICMKFHINMYSNWMHWFPKFIWKIIIFDRFVAIFRSNLHNFWQFKPFSPNFTTFLKKLLPPHLFVFIRCLSYLYDLKSPIGTFITFLHIMTINVVIFLNVTEVRTNHVIFKMSINWKNTNIWISIILI